MSERDRVEAHAGWYLKEQLDVDRRLIEFRYRTLRPYVVGPAGLELGPAEGEMTRLLVRDFARLTVVEGSRELLDRIPRYPNLVLVHSLFEEYEPRERFNSIVLDHVLEHVEDPVGLLRRASSWLAPGGRLLIGVPNGHSVHRLAGVKMGLLAHPCELNARDHALGHRRVYTSETLRRDLDAAGLRVIALQGVFFKPLSNEQIEKTCSHEMIEAFYELGRDFSENCADLFAASELR